MGWAYLVNDEKIAEIGRYIRYTLAEKVMALTGDTDVAATFGWEIAHRSDRWRHQRKFEQLVIDELTFVLSGMTALFAFGYIACWHLKTKGQLPPIASYDLSISPPVLVVLSGVEFLLLVFLAIEIYIYADLARGR